MGVLYSIKSNYKFRLLEKMVELLESSDAHRRSSAKMSAGTKGVYEGHPAHVLDAAEFIFEVYTGISKEMVQKVFG